MYETQPNPKLLMEILAMPMKQAGTDYGKKGETGEKISKATKSADASGEKSTGKVNGVAIGQEDKTGRSNGSKEKGEYNTGRSDSVCYSHKKGV